MQGAEGKGYPRTGMGGLSGRRKKRTRKSVGDGTSWGAQEVTGWQNEGRTVSGAVEMRGLGRKKRVAALGQGPEKEAR